MSRLTVDLVGVHTTDTHIPWKYIGEINSEGLRHGHGKCVALCPDSEEVLSTYIGFWVNGRRSGQGTVMFARGHIYQGEWLDDEQHGDGVYYSPAFDPSQRLTLGFRQKIGF
jgi:hypothetical protein